MPDISGVFRDPFNEQVAFFRGKLGNLEPTESWTEKQKEQHDRAFVVAGATKAELLADLAAAVDKAIAQGTSIEEFRKDFKNAADRHRWNYRGEFNWRTRVIYNTNLRTSYAAGRLVQLQEFSYWTYKHSGAENYRPQHRSWHNLTLPKEHAFWRTHYPPNGWGCGCRVVGTRSPEEARHIGGEMRPAPNDGINPRTGTPNGIDKGWDYMPGATVKEAVKAAAEKLPRLPAEIGAALFDSLSPKHIEHLTEAFGEFATDAVNDSVDRGTNTVVGGISVKHLKELKKHGYELASAEILARHEDIRHSYRVSKEKELDFDFYKRMPQNLRHPDMVVLDVKNPKRPTLLYFFNTDKGLVKSVVQLNIKDKIAQLDQVATRKKRENMLFNTMRTGHYIGDKSSTVQPNYIVLEGSV